MEKQSEGDLRRRLDGVTAELLAAYEELEVLGTVAEIAGAAADVAVAGRRILEEAAELLEADVAFIFYTDPELSGEEPLPIGVSAQERDALAKILSGWLSAGARPTVMAPFQEGAGVRHAPDALTAVPLRCEGQVLGAICLGRRGEGRTFSAGDLKILIALATSAAAVLLQRKNLDLSRLTRRLEDRNKLFKGLLTISGEIASSLDLDRLLHAVSNLSARVLGFDRCAVLLDEGARRRLRAVSGVRKVDRTDPELASLERLLDWVAGRGVQVIVDLDEAPAGGGAGAEPAVSARPAEAADQAVAHMKQAGARSFLALPLADDQGLLGVLSFESETAGFVDDTRLEGARILANQATVALRNARLYSDVPLIGLLAPIRRGMAKARSLPRRRAALWGAGALIILSVLVLGRWEMRVPGRALVMPSRVVQVSARVRGVIREIGPYAEGDRVARGEVLARLDANDLALRLNEAQAKAAAAAATMTRLEAQGKAAELRQARVEEERWRGEASHFGRRIDEASLRAPIDGILLTPRLAERTGELLEVGGVLCTLADTEHLRVEIAVRESDADVILGRLGREGAAPLGATVKFSAYPEIDYLAEIGHVRSAVEMVEGARSLVVEGTLLESPGSALKPGMTGRARIDAGSRSVIALLLRRPYRFLRSMIWL